MPDFIAILAASALFCGTVIVLNGLTRLLIQMHGPIGDLAENGFAQYGLALALAGLVWRRVVRRNAL
ncbi:hypothetical protein [Methylobacterium sp. Leaf89]|uniref:hypothetical protein n=1 Tax=Methylobacterium sp. Leaf89 TaxID=1736245 RepID=UPI0006FB342D|nr:hypothetical protein [Methylobacterium sp. Leaf89]KQO67349.1 hypothetical protein ASF18_11910 [Methylobacterium sp. Leaf89]